MPAPRRIACALLLLAGCTDAPRRMEREAAARTIVRPARGEAISIRRVPENDLWVDEPGVLVIRDGDAWRTLWQRYGRNGPAAAPPLDFSRRMVAAVSLGGISSCASSERYVDRVEQDRDSLFVVIGYGAYPQEDGEMVCAQQIAPVDLLVLPRSDLPAAFVGATNRAPLPGPAAWLAKYTAAQLDSLPPERRARFRVFLARDSSTSHAEIVRLVDGVQPYGDGAVADALLHHPGVQRDAALLQRIAALGYAPERVGQLLLEHHGASLARDPATPPETLRLLVAALDRAQKPYAPTARLALRHPTVAADRELLETALHAVTRKHLTCAEVQLVWERVNPPAPGAPPAAGCAVWDDSPRPPGLRSPVIHVPRPRWPEQRGAPPRLRGRSPEPRARPPAGDSAAPPR